MIRQQLDRAKWMRDLKLYDARHWLDCLITNSMYRINYHWLYQLVQADYGQTCPRSVMKDNTADTFPFTFVSFLKGSLTYWRHSYSFEEHVNPIHLFMETVWTLDLIDFDRLSIKVHVMLIPGIPWVLPIIAYSKQFQSFPCKVRNRSAIVNTRNQYMNEGD